MLHQGTFIFKKSVDIWVALKSIWGEKNKFVHVWLGTAQPSLSFYLYTTGCIKNLLPLCFLSISQLPFGLRIKSYDFFEKPIKWAVQKYQKFQFNVQNSPRNSQFCTSKQKLILTKYVHLKSVSKHKGEVWGGYQGEWWHLWEGV